MNSLKQFELKTMKQNLLLLIAVAILLFAAVNVKGQTKKTVKRFALFGINSFQAYPVIQNYTYLFIGGKVKFTSKNGWLITVKDTSKLCIKYADSVFVLHISPKFATKINDSTYTFKNE